MPKHELAQQTARLRRAIARYDANSSARPAGFPARDLDALMTSARSPRTPA
jgi:hypothetical protein